MLNPDYRDMLSMLNDEAVEYLVVFVFLFVCSMWALGNRISASEMAMKEQLLRLECRLADLSERLKT